MSRNYPRRFWVLIALSLSLTSTGWAQTPPVSDGEGQVGNGGRDSTIFLRSAQTVVTQMDRHARFFKLEFEPSIDVARLELALRTPIAADPDLTVPAEADLSQRDQPRIRIHYRLWKSPEHRKDAKAWSIHAYLEAIGIDDSELKVSRRITEWLRR